MSLPKIAIIAAGLSLGMIGVARADEPPPASAPEPATPAAVPAAPALAREPSVPDVTDAMTHYFRGEKHQGYGWGITGAAALTLGAGLYVTDKPFERAASYPIMIVGVVQSFVAVLSLVRPDGRIAANKERINANPSLFLQEERERVRTVNRFFVGVELFEVAVTVTGIGLVGAGLHDHDKTLSGVGTGLVVQGAAMFILDSVAHARAERYEHLLLGGTATKDGATLTTGSRF